MNKEKKIIKWFILPVLLAVYCFWDVNKGVDLSDTGYNLERFYNFMESAGSGLSTFWSNYIGYLFTKLPGADSWLGMMCYCTLIILAIVLIAYFFCIQFLNCYVVFLCEIVALAMFWIPASVLYDSLTFLFLEVAVVFLYYAIERKRDWYFIYAGICLGINALVRMPNITEVILILLVWCYAWLNREALKSAGKLPWAVSKTGLCITGYLCGVVGSLLVSLQFSDLEMYGQTVNRLSGHTSVEGYGLSQMAFGTLIYIFGHMKYLLMFAAVMGIAVGMLWIGNKLIEDANLKRWLAGVVYLLATCSSIVILYISYKKWEVFSTDYEQYTSIKGIMALVYLCGIMIGVVNMCYKAQKKDILAGLLYLILLWVIPLGSNNQIYLDISNSFLLLPLICYLIKNLLEKMRERTVFKVVMAPIAVLVFVQTVLFGFHFSFGESDINCKFEKTNILRGMWTSEEKVAALDGLLHFMENTDIQHKGILQYCDSPGLIYVLQEQRGIERSWPELSTYSPQAFVQELELIEEEREYPFIILGNDLGDFYKVAYGESDVYVENEDIYRADEKIRALLLFIDENGYEIVYDDEKTYTVFAVY